MPDLHIVDNAGLLFKDFEKHFLDEKTADVVFLVEGQKLPAHRLMLASHCEYFEKLLYEKAFKEAEQFEVELKETGVSSFKILLDYFYKGTLDLQTFDIEEVVEILELSDRYGLETLKKQVVKFLELKVSDTNVLRVLEVAITLQLGELEDNCWWILAMAVEGIYDLDIVCQLNPQHFRKFLDFCTDRVSATKLFNTAMLLIEKCSEQPEIQKQMQLDVKELIKFSNIPVEELFGQVRKSNVFDSDEFITLIERLSKEGRVDKALKVPNKNLFDEPDCPKTVKDLPEVLDLGRKMLINNIKFQFHLNSGVSRYKIEVSTDLKNWITVYQPFESCCLKQNIFFSDIGAKYIKVSGLTSDKILQQIYADIEAHFIPNPPAQVAGYVWPNETVPCPPYIFNICNAEKKWSFCENVLNIDNENENTPFITQKLSLQLSDEHCFRILFNHPCLISSFRFRLWDYDGRKYSFRVKVRSRPGYTPIVMDKSDELLGGWQTVTFSPRPVSDIFIYCVKTTIGDDFRFAYFEVPAKP